MASDIFRGEPNYGLTGSQQRGNSIENRKLEARVRLTAEIPHLVNGRSPNNLRLSQMKDIEKKLGILYEHFFKVASVPSYGVRHFPR